jgi:hypothetical protein
MAVKKDKYDVLADVVAALRDFNKKVVIETLDAQDTGWAFASYGDNVPYIPTRRAKNTMNGVVSLARMHAKSIKIGRDISIKRIHRKPTLVKTEKQEYEVDNGSYYLVRTPKGEAKFERTDDDFLTVWNYALSMYDGTANYMEFYRNLRNEKVKKIAGGPAVLKNEKANKFNDSIKRLEALGVDPKGLVDYIQSKMSKDI